MRGNAVRLVCLTTALASALTVRTIAQVEEPVVGVSSSGPPPLTGPAVPDVQSPNDKPVTRAAASDQATTHILGVLPNYLTVEGTDAAPISADRKFKLVALNTFDPFMYPYVGGIALVTHNYGPRASGFEKQYLASVTDNVLGNFMTSAVLPSLLHQDPRYFERGSGGWIRRVAYAASRNIVTRSDSGRAQFNLSEIGGNAVAASAASLYYPRTQRTASAMVTRWGMQMFWDTVSNEMKEFWPDVRNKLHRHE